MARLLYSCPKCIAGIAPPKGTFFFSIVFLSPFLLECFLLFRVVPTPFLIVVRAFRDN